MIGDGSRVGAEITEGLPYPLGAVWDGLGVNFALFSAHATAAGEIAEFKQ